MTIKRCAVAARRRNIYICDNGRKKWRNTMVGYAYEAEHNYNGNDWVQADTLEGLYRWIMKHPIDNRNDWLNYDIIGY